MKIVIFSGGTGSIALTEGIKTLFPQAQIKTIINAYDDGKSTGICRKVMNVLGPSDIRKRHAQLYKLSHKNPDVRILEFFENRYDILENREQFCIDLLKKWNLETELSFYIHKFFENIDNYKLKIDLLDFNIANIAYAAMFHEIGYENTIFYFETLFHIQDEVILHSFSNLWLKAKTKSGKILETEEAITIYKNAEDPIVDIYTNASYKNEANPNLKALEAIKESDFIICAPGTQWSSLIPTYYCKPIAKAIEDAAAFKILIMNNMEDGDSYGLTNCNIIDNIEKYLKLETFTILLNLDANENFRKEVSKHKSVSRYLGNIHGKHDAKRLAVDCFKLFYHLNNDSKILICDFDDTLYTREINDKQKVETSIENIRLLNKISIYIQCIISTGNSYQRIFERVSPVIGGDMKSNIRIFADGGLVEYVNNKIVYFNSDFCLEEPANLITLLRELNLSFKVSFRGSKDANIHMISIRPLEENYRLLLVKYLNQYFAVTNLNNIAKLAGKTSVDITNKKLNKVELLKILDITDNPTIYIGDEIDFGNDEQIAKQCKKQFIMKSVFETNLYLKLFLEQIFLEQASNV